MRCREVCRLLLERGAPPDAGQQHGWTALMSAGMVAEKWHAALAARLRPTAAV